MLNETRILTSQGQFKAQPQRARRGALSAAKEEEEKKKISISQNSRGSAMRAALQSTLDYWCGHPIEWHKRNLIIAAIRWGLHTARSGKTGEGIVICFHTVRFERPVLELAFRQ